MRVMPNMNIWRTNWYSRRRNTFRNDYLWLLRTEMTVLTCLRSKRKITLLINIYVRCSTTVITSVTTCIWIISMLRWERSIRCTKGPQEVHTRNKIHYKDKNKKLERRIRCLYLRGDTNLVIGQRKGVAILGIMMGGEGIVLFLSSHSNNCYYRNSRSNFRNNRLSSNEGLSNICRHSCSF